MSKSKKILMLKRTSAVKLFEALGLKKAGKWDTKRIKQKQVKAESTTKESYSCKEGCYHHS